MARLQLPPRYINLPAALVYDHSIKPVVRDTYVLLRGLAWKNQTETPEMSWDELVEITGKPVSTLYAHLAALRDRGWLLFSRAGTGMIIVRFLDINSEKSESLNEDVNLIDSVNSENHHPTDESFNNGENFRKIRKILKNQKNSVSSNGWHEAIDDDLAELLDRIGVYREKFLDVATSGWAPWQLRKLAETVLDELGPGNGGGVFLYRLINRKPPQSEADYRRAYVAGDWGAYVEH